MFVRFRLLPSLAVPGKQSSDLAHLLLPLSDFPNSVLVLSLSCFEIKLGSFFYLIVLVLKHFVHLCELFVDLLNNILLGCL